MKYRHQRTRTDKISRACVEKELRKAARTFNFREFGKRDFDEVSKISASTVVREFDGSWKAAMRWLHADLLRNDANGGLQPRSRRQYSDAEMFQEMERIWQECGQRPSRNEWNSCDPSISYQTYVRYFKSWPKACLKFIEFKMGRGLGVQDGLTGGAFAQGRKENVAKGKTRARSIPLQTRLNVLKRDGFRCVLCGNSPAITPGVILHLDHIILFSQGGTHNANNLRVLCQQCNLGRGASDVGQTS